MDWLDDYQLYHDKFRELAAWYSGSSERLLDYYLTDQQNGRVFVNKYNLDKKGMFWEKDIHNDRATMLHIPVASDIASTSADLLFSEMPEVKIMAAHEENADSQATDAQERLDEIIDRSDMYSRLLEMAETSAALGGVFVKIDWDDDLRDFPVVIGVQPDNAVWEFKWGFLQRVKFYKIIDQPDTNLYYRLEEIREKGRIEHHLYKGTTMKLGSEIPLTSKEETADLPPEINHDIDSLLAWYIPNKRPNRLWRGSPLGESDLFGIIGIMDSIDETYTNLIRDIRLGRGKVLVPEYMLDKDDEGFKYDMDKSVYTLAGIANPEKEGKVDSIQFEIRTQAHIDAIQDLLQQAYSLAGYSPGTFGIGEVTNNATATEIKQQQSKSYKTRNKKAKYFRAKLDDIFMRLLQVDDLIFDSNNGEQQVQVTLQDSVATDPMDMADSLKKLNDAMALSVDTKVRKLHPNWTEEQIEQEVNSILKENGMTVESPEMRA